jgi:hypothetical protein
MVVGTSTENIEARDPSFYRERAFRLRRTSHRITSFVPAGPRPETGTARWIFDLDAATPRGAKEPACSIGRRVLFKLAAVGSGRPILPGLGLAVALGGVRPSNSRCAGSLHPQSASA